MVREIFHVELIIIISWINVKNVVYVSVIIIHQQGQSYLQEQEWLCGMLRSKTEQKTKKHNTRQS